MYIRYICNKNTKSSYDLCTFPLFYKKIDSEKALILFAKYTEIVILELWKFKIFFFFQPWWQAIFYTILAPPPLLWEWRCRN